MSINSQEKAALLTPTDLDGDDYKNENAKVLLFLFLFILYYSILSYYIILYHMNYILYTVYIHVSTYIFCYISFLLFPEPPITYLEYFSFVHIHGVFLASILSLNINRCER